MKNVWTSGFQLNITAHIVNIPRHIKADIKANGGGGIQTTSLY